MVRRRTKVKSILFLVFLAVAALCWTLLVLDAVELEPYREQLWKVLCVAVAIALLCSLKFIYFVFQALRARTLRGKISGLLTVAFFPLVVRLSGLDAQHKVTGVAPLSPAFFHSLKPTPSGWIAKMDVKKDSDVNRWADSSGEIARHLFLKPDQLEISTTGKGSMTFRARAFDTLLSEPIEGEKLLSVGAFAKNEDGLPLKWARAHTLIAGVTGSGKGSISWAILRSIKASGLPYIAYGLDPKKSEFFFDGAGAFDRVAYTPHEIADLLSELVPYASEGGEGRTFKPSPSNPYRLIFIDELPSLFSGMDTKMRKQAHEDLESILRKGRSRGVLVISQTQEVTKEVVDSRNSYQLRIAARLEKKADVDLLLGAGCWESGAKADQIPIAVESNGYRSAGAFYMRSEDEGGGIVRGRALYTTDQDLANLAYSSPSP